MSWTIIKDTLYDRTSLEVAYFLPGASQQERLMIEKCDDLLNLVGGFVVGYDEKKQVSKKVYDQLTSLIDSSVNYQFKWLVDREGALINQQGQLICIFSNPNSFHVKFICYLPELYSAAQDLSKSLSATKGLALKNVYNRICDYYDKAN